MYKHTYVRVGRYLPMYVSIQNEWHSFHQSVNQFYKDIAMAINYVRIAYMQEWDVIKGGGILLAYL